LIVVHRNNSLTIDISFYINSQGKTTKAIFCWYRADPQISIKCPYDTRYINWTIEDGI